MPEIGRKSDPEFRDGAVRHPRRRTRTHALRVIVGALARGL
jgi:hypothetical protein